MSENDPLTNSSNDTKFIIDENQIDIIKLKSDIDITTLDCTDEDNKDDEELHKFINEDALNDQTNKLSVTRLLYYNNKLIGYFTIAMYCIVCDYFKEDDRPMTNTTKMYPALILTHVAIDKKFRNNGFGRFIIKWVIGFGRVESKKIGCRYIALFAHNKIDFYLKNNFILCEGQEKKKYKLLVSLLSN